MYWQVAFAFVAAAALSPTSQSTDHVIPVVGLKTGFNSRTGQPPPRQELRDLENSGPAWDLYVQGLRSFQSVSEDDEKSYFRVSGIHGRPFTPFNGVQRADGSPEGGYCIHNEIIFSTWHRPYVALFEQLLGQHIQEIAARYQRDQEAIYRQAADSWRMPYWDWAVDRRLPDVLTASTLTVTGPQGPITLPNPLLTYRFQQFPLNETLFPPDCDFNLYSYPTTVRCPDPRTNQSNQGLASDGVGAIDLARQVYNVYTRILDFESMSTTAYDGSSFENQHNEIHVAVGCMHPVGHLADFPYSGFDPVFMLHHCSIDRHIALWQAIHYNASMFNVTYTSETGAFATAPGTIISADSPLKPFYADNTGRFHTSNSVRDVRDLGYTYPELEGQHDMSNQDLSGAVMKAVNRLYGGTVISSPSKRSPYGSGHMTREYYLRLQVDKARTSLPAVINVWVGQVFAGRLVLPVSPPLGVVHEEIPLDRGLRMSNVSSTNPEIVIPFLRNMLRPEARRFDGSFLPASNISNMQIYIRCDEVWIPQNPYEFPRYGATISWPWL